MIPSIRNGRIHFIAGIRDPNEPGDITAAPGFAHIYRTDTTLGTPDEPGRGSSVQHLYLDRA